MIGVMKKGFAATLLLALVFAAGSAFAQAAHTSKPFAGPKANKGTVTHSKVGGKN